MTSGKSAIVRKPRAAVVNLSLVVAELLSLGASAPLPDWNASERAEVTMLNFAFVPSSLRLRFGHFYRMHFMNPGSGGHDFTAPAFFDAATIGEQDRQYVAEGRIRLGQGESRDVLLVPATEAYPLKCSHFLHATFGMTGVIIVS